MPAKLNAPAFDALDECHRQMQQQLFELAALVERIEEVGLDDAEVRRVAGAVERFFSTTSRQHHQQEESSVFPLLLAGSNADLASVVRMLQQDHGWIEENWIELEPMLSGIARGNQWIDPADLRHNAEVFTNLCLQHLNLEESVVYPQAKARFAQALAARKARTGT